MKPRIAIPEPTSTDIPYNQRSWQSYADAVTRSGGEPVKVNLFATQADIRELAQTCDGVCLPGSPADIDPLRDDGVQLESKLKADGVQVTRTLYDGVTHDFFGMSTLLSQARAAQGTATAALRQSLQ